MPESKINDSELTINLKDEQMEEESIDVKPNIAKEIKHKRFINKYFQDYYVTQAIIPENDLVSFMESQISPLPQSYSIVGDINQIKLLQTILKKNFLANLTQIDLENGLEIPPQSISWCDNETTWQWKINFSKTFNHSILNEFRKFMFQQTVCANIIEENPLSILPIKLLDVQPHHKVIDMNGFDLNKSQQLMSIIYNDTTKIPDGILLATETQLKKSHQLAESIKKYTYPGIAVVNADNKYLPEFVIKEKETNDETVIKFDRILTHLNSSNDGLFRCNLEGLKSWTCNLALEKHGYLCEMINSGLGILSVGGKLVYSVHSLNPIECEAVVSTVLIQQKGSVELLDISSEMPDLKYEKALTSWQVLAHGQRWFKIAEEVPEALWPQIWTSMFPPAKDISDKQALNRCIRILPHKQNTAGMFIAVFKRTSLLEDALKREEEEAWKAWELERAKEEERKLEEAKKTEEKRIKKLDKKRRLQEQRRKASEIICGKPLEGEDLIPGQEELYEKLQEAKKLEKEKFENEIVKDDPEEKSDIKNDEQEDKIDGNNISDEAKKSILNQGAINKDGVNVEKDDTITDSNKVNVEIKKEKLDDFVVGAESMDGDSISTTSRGIVVVSKEENKNMDNLKKKKNQNGREKFYSSRQDPRDKDFNDENREAIKTVHCNKSKSVVEDPYLFLQPEDTNWKKIVSHFGLSAEFPMHLLVTRLVLGFPVNYFLVTEKLKQFILGNQTKYNIVRSGVKILTHVDHPNIEFKFRLDIEGLTFIYPFMTKQLLSLSKRDFLTLISAPNCLAPLENLSSSTQNKIKKLEPGSFLAAQEPTKKDDYKTALLVSCWKTHDGIVRMYLPEYQRSFFLRVLGVAFKNYDDSDTACDAKSGLKAFANAFVEIQS